MTCHLDHFNSLSQVENFSKKKEKGMNEWIYQWNKPCNKQTPAEDTKHEAAPKLKKNQTCRASIKLRKNFFSLEKLKPGLYASSDLTLPMNTQTFLLSKNNNPLQT